MLSVKTKYPVMACFSIIPAIVSQTEIYSATGLCHDDELND
ncbi:hypothetical protein SSYIS1_13940 [Serratia symbiotica]|uniref:Uncharacterized protein n=1 Tax=Serratia symbiotica TaxID=138074 RepID=A0A455VFK9_9GAMM|nr:hypothetical protein SSYIS1_13940 [Serratia symbiotica]